LVTPPPAAVLRSLLEHVPNTSLTGQEELVLLANPAAQRLLAQLRDCLERERAERARWEEVAARAKLEGALLVARTAAHQLNNALAPILGYAELLSTMPEVARNPTAAAYARSIEEAAASCADLVLRLQRIVRLEETPSPLGPDKPILDLDRSAP
jgi:signal transduction histidine kinase